LAASADVIRRHIEIHDRNYLDSCFENPEELYLVFRDELGEGY
jgi:hypothetical protein